MVILTGAFGLFDVRMIASVLVTIAGMLTAISTIARSREADSAIEEKEAEIEAFESPRQETESIAHLLQRHINIAIGHEEITMLRAERRANILYSLGQLFLVASILGPVLSLLAYWYVDPLPVSTIQHLKELQTELGDLPADVAVSVQRDWRILLSGVSFGFLLLAAATGLLRQQAKELNVYFRIAERVNSYKRLESVLEIKTHAATETQTELDSVLMELVVETLLARGTESGDDKPEEQEPVDAKGVLDIAKALKGIAN